MKRAVLGFLCILVTVSTSAFSQNLLVNPGFETNYTGWTAAKSGTGATAWWSGSLGSGFNEGHTGTSSTLALKNGGNAGETVAVTYWQQVNVVAGAQYEISAWYKAMKDSTAWDGAGGLDQTLGINIQIYNASGAAVQYLYGPKVETLQTQWTKLNWIYNMRPDAHHIRVYYYATLRDSFDTAYVKWDDAYVGTVPEPSSMVVMLSGLAGLAGFARRRR